MKRTLQSILLFAFAASIVTSCTPINAQVTTDYNHVIILGFDGWGALSFQDADMPFLQQQLSESAWTIHKRSIIPAESACNWVTMFKGVGPEAHGYYTGMSKEPAFDVTYTDEKGNFPSLFSVFRHQYPEREMGYIYQWEKMSCFFDTNDFNYTNCFPISFEGSEQMKEEAVSYIIKKKPTLAAFIWDYPDKTGHTNGWYSSEYMQELTHIDSIIESVYSACIKAGIIDNTLFIVTSDHGGHDYIHGHAVISDLETPFIMFGKGVSPGEIKVPLMQYDVTSIVADYLSLQQPSAWRGKTPDSILIRSLL